MLLVCSMKSRSVTVIASVGLVLAVAWIEAPRPARGQSPAAPSQARPPTAPPDGWWLELPRRKAVYDAYYRGDVQSVGELTAAMGTLRDYFHLRLGSIPKYGERFSGLWRELDGENEVWSEKDRAAPLAQRSFGDPEFRIRVLSRFLSPASVALYRNSASFRSLLEQQARGDDPRALPTKGPPALIADARMARKAHVDLSTFGINLGEALRLVVCPTSTSGPLGDVLAIPKDDTLGNAEPDLETPCFPKGVGAQMILNAESRDDLAGAEMFLVQIPKRKCPDWLRAGKYNCTITVAQVEDVVVRVAFPTGGLDWQGAIDKNLTKKYGPATLGKEYRCQMRATGLVTYKWQERRWTMPGLVVSYAPLGQNCPSNEQEGRGWISVQLASFARARHTTAAKKEAEEPGM
jgi:hypothetical protein